MNHKLMTRILDNLPVTHSESFAIIHNYTNPMLANIQLAINGNSDRYRHCHDSWHKFPCAARQRIPEEHSSANPPPQRTNAPKHNRDGSPKTNTRPPANTNHRERLDLTPDEISTRKKQGLFIYSGPPGKKPKFHHHFNKQDRRPCTGWTFRGSYCSTKDCTAHHPSFDLSKHTPTDVAAIKKFVATEPNVKLANARTAGE
jgi:hypothetical protein